MEELGGSTGRESPETVPDNTWTISCLHSFLRDRGGRLSGKNAIYLIGKKLSDFQSYLS